MDEEGSYLEQYCEECREETDQRASDVSALATCLRCGSAQRLMSEDDRVRALMGRVREDAAASLDRLRNGFVPLPWA
jgi:hypothetical protein